jgi:maltose O-acetyltransferase
MFQILPGCTIGDGAVIAAGAVVTKDVEPFTVNAGIPCKKIGERNRNLTYIFNGDHVPFI